MIFLSLPYPPSVNHYYRTFNGRVVISAAGKAYKDRAGWLARAAQAELLTGDVCLTAHVYRPQKRGDLDNISKCLLDSLNGIAYADDSQIVEMHLYRHDDKLNPRVEVTIGAIE